MSEENIKRYTLKEIEEMVARGESRTNWARLAAMTDEEIDAAAMDDPDCAPEDLDWSTAVFVYPGVREAVNVQLDRDLVLWFQKQGPEWETRINRVLRDHVEQAQSRAAE